MSRIIVKNLPTHGVSQDDIKKHFADIDNVTDVTLKFNDNGAFRRFAFVGFKSHDGADNAIQKLNNTFIKNSKITLESCKAIRDKKIERADEVVDTNEKKAAEAEERPKTRNKKQKGKEEDEDIFQAVKDDPEFKEFLDLQRNIGETTKAKHIWSDDAKMDVENVLIPNSDDEGDEDNKSSKKESPVDGEKPRKKHKRSRGERKKSEKTKPDELFVHTVKIKGFPKEARRKDVKDFFRPLQLLSIRLNKRDEVCYASFKDESDLKFALRKNLQFLGTTRIKLWRHDVKRSKVFKEQVKEKIKKREDTVKKQAAVLAETEPISESGRLFVRNLNYTCTQEDLERVFSDYGELTEVHLPIDKATSLPKGYAYVEFMFPRNATRAYEELNGTIFQGRNFHLIPSKPKPEPKFAPTFDGPRDSQSKFKREKLAEQKQAAPKGSNWNILFLGQNALADIVSNQRGIEKSKLLTQQTKKDPIAVRMALGDASAVEEMRKFLISNGIELDSFDNPQAPRSKTVIIVKNLPAGTSKSDISEMFERHGRVGRVIVPPNGMTAIVEMEESTEAKLAFKKLAYSKFKDSILYLEWAPINVFRSKSLGDQEQDDIKQLESIQTGTKILVKNIPFEATLAELRKIFVAFGELNFVRIPKKMDGQHRGFGFVDYLTRDDALRAFRSLCHSTHLYGRKLVLEWAKSDESSGGKSRDNEQQAGTSGQS